MGIFSNLDNYLDLRRLETADNLTGVFFSSVTGDVLERRNNNNDSLLSSGENYFS